MQSNFESWHLCTQGEAPSDKLVYTLIGYGFNQVICVNVAIVKGGGLTLYPISSNFGWLSHTNNVHLCLMCTLQTEECRLSNPQ